MAQRWSFEEDYIVCTFCRDEYFDFELNQQEKILKSKLEKLGFKPRTIGAIKKRMEYFMHLRFESAFKDTPRQVKGIFNTIKNKTQFKEEYQRLQSVLDNRRRELKENGGDYIDNLYDSILNNALGLINYTKGLSFQKLLFQYIDEKDISDVDAYTNSMVSRFVFSQIRSNENKRISKETALCFCFGLKLTYEQSELLLKTAGYAFSTFDDFDLLVGEYILERKYDIDMVNAQLYERKLPLLFGGYNDSDDTSKKAKKKGRKRKIRE